jgi:Calx-beta domain-containing protein
MKPHKALWISCSLALAAAIPAAAAGPGVIKFDEATFEVAESAGTAVVRVERSGGESGAVTVHYATSDGTAAAGQDYTAVSGTLSWSAGDGTVKTFTIPITDDTASEGAETVHLALSGPTGGAAIDSARGTADVVILANDGGSGGGGDGDDHGEAGEIKFDQSDFQVLENAPQAVITIERSGGERGAVTVQFATSNDTATAGQDYTAVSGTLSWADGQEGSKTILVPILDDQRTEGSESVHLLLSNPTGGAVLDHERSAAVLTILEGGRSGSDPEDEHSASAPGTIHFDNKSFQAVEGFATARIVVERSRGSHGVVSVHFQTVEGSARSGEDYSFVSGVLTWANGDEQPKIITVPIADDSMTEGNETVLLTLADPTGGATIDSVRGTATLNILDNDGSTAACSLDDDTLCLNDDRFKVEVVWRLGQGQTGKGHAVRLTGESGTFWFFGASNLEMLLKVLNACPATNTFWVYFAATTDVDFTLTVTDTHTGVVKQYANPGGRAAEPVQDSFTFATCGQ